MKTYFLNIALAFIVASGNAHANKISSVVSSSSQIDINKPYSLNLTFSDRLEDIRCGLTIDWGDGKIEKFRVGEGQQILPPFKVEHSYTEPGEYKIRIEGSFITRGMRSVLGCDVMTEGVVSVIDPVEAAKQAQIKAAAERERLERMQLEDQARRDKEETLRLLAVARAEKETEERKRRQAEQDARVEQERIAHQNSMKSLLVKASIKNCNQFVEAFRAKYKFAYDWPELKCSFAADNDAAFLITAFNPARERFGASAYSRFFYQPKSETVLQITGRGDQTVLNVKNFIDIKKALDMNASGDIELENLPIEQQKLVCGKLSTVSKNIVEQHGFRIAAGFEVSEIAKAGNWDFDVAKNNMNCSLIFSVSGSYRGTSYRQSISCRIGSIIKQSNGNYMATSISYDGGACRKI